MLKIKCQSFILFSGWSRCTNRVVVRNYRKFKVHSIFWNIRSCVHHFKIKGELFKLDTIDTYLPAPSWKQCVLWPFHLGQQPQSSGQKRHCFPQAQWISWGYAPWYCSNLAWNEYAMTAQTLAFFISFFRFFSFFPVLLVFSGSHRSSGVQTRQYLDKILTKSRFCLRR